MGLLMIQEQGGRRGSEGSRWGKTTIRCAASTHRPIRLSVLRYCPPPPKPKSGKRVWAPKFHPGTENASSSGNSRPALTQTVR
ncbi:hypothetical protein XELAEV_18008646mg [Xenopus laevis]|uniref:Uncharacterized protein n=1 Tax=Xenopus laevis TaxID=8355 RepID=A0A974I694_XENLA|nr:hypothetical protein XELAEV_18008646mg [Xenopus laevis]